MVPADAQYTHDQPHWPKHWLAYTEYDGRTVVLHNYNPGAYYVCHGTTEVPCLRDVFSGPDRETAEAFYTVGCALLRGWEIPT